MQTRHPDRAAAAGSRIGLAGGAAGELHSGVQLSLAPDQKEDARTDSKIGAGHYVSQKKES